VKADLDAGGADPSHGSLGWDLGSSRKAWNRAKGGVAPWSADNFEKRPTRRAWPISRAMDNWNASKTGTHKGRRVGFPGFKSARRDPGRAVHHRGDAAGTGPAHDHGAPHRGSAIQ